MSDRRVYIAQLLCPQRHAIMAVAEEFDTAEEAESLRELLKEVFDGIAATMPVVSRCALCRSSDFQIEVGATGLRNIAEARPVLLVKEAKRHATQLFLKSHRN